MATNPVFPRVHALVVCDEIHPHPGEGAVCTLVGVRTQIVADRFPYTHPQLCVYLQATGHPGTAPCKVVVMSADDEQLTSTAERQVQFDGPLSVNVLVWWITDCTFPDPGLYYVQVYFGPKLANERMLLLTERGVPGNGQGAA